MSNTALGVFAPVSAFLPIFRKLICGLVSLWALFGLSVLPALAQDASNPPVLNGVEISDSSAVSDDVLELRYSAFVSGGLGRVQAYFMAENGGGLHVEAEEPSWGHIRIPIRDGHLDGAYRLEYIHIEEDGNSDNFVTYQRDGVIQGRGEPGTHGLDFTGADFTVSGNGTTDTIAPQLLWILRDAGGSYRYVALDDGEGVVGLSVELIGPDGSETAALTRSPGNQGWATVRLMHGAPEGLYRVASVTLRDGARPSNTIRYMRDGTVQSTDPDAPQSHGFGLAALDFIYGAERPEPPVLNSIRHDGDGEFTFAASSPTGIAEVEVVVRRPDGSLGIARPLAAGAEGRAVLPLGAGFPQGQHLIEAVRLRDASDPAVHVEYRRDGLLLSPAFDTPQNHNMGLWSMDFGWFGGALRTSTSLNLPPSAMFGEDVIAEVEVTSLHGTPQGWLHLLHDDRSIASARLDDEGRSQITLENLEVGRYEITARFSGSAEFQPSDSEAVVLQVQPDLLNVPGFIGGGSVFGLTEACQPVLGAQSHGVTVRYSPSELGGLPSGVTIAWPEGSEHLALWGPLEPDPLFKGGAGRSVWSRFVFSAQPIPLIRVGQRRVIVPENAGIEQAEELVLRLRVQNFAATQGCSVTLVASLKRDGRS